MKHNVYLGTEVSKVINIISEFRIKYFREFPYLYEGTLKYEKEYFEEFSKSQNAYVEVIMSDNQIIGVATGVPLNSNTDIIKDAKKLFLESGYDINKIFYIGEVIIDKKFRGKSLSLNLLNNLENFASSLNLKQTVFSTVIRKEDDIRKPKNYISPDGIWQKANYKKTKLIFNYHWPTILEDKSVVEMENPMIFWIKNL